MMDYDEYIRIQTVVHGAIKKPWKYREGQRRAIDWFFEDIDKDKRILDLGCGEGAGIKHLLSLGYKDLVGVDIHPRKVQLARRRHLPVFQRDIHNFEFGGFDIVWSSHSFEHMFDPSEAIEVLKTATKPDASFFFVMPYPDTGDETAHCSSREIGLREKDLGESVRKWFYEHGLLCRKQKIDDYREPEIWLKLRKNEQKTNKTQKRT